jgi:hypothetical protein
VYVVCTDKNGYGFSLTRFPEESLIHLMVEDQTNCPTRELVAELYRDRLVVGLGSDIAKQIGIPGKYVVPLDTSEEQLSQIDSALSAIFSGVGHYHRQI